MLVSHTQEWRHNEENHNPVVAAMLLLGVGAATTLTTSPAAALTACEKTQTCTAPTPVPTVTAKVAAGGFRVTWTAPVNKGGLPVSYTVDTVDMWGTTVNSQTVTTRAVNVTGLEAATTYAIYVTASNKVGAATPTVITPTTAGVPTDVRSVKTTVTGKDVTVRWAAPSSNGGLGPITYRLQLAGNEVVLPRTARTHTFTNVPKGEHYLSIWAENPMGSGPITNTLVTVTTVDPAAATLVTTPTLGNVNLSWNDTGADRYEVYRVFKDAYSVAYGLPTTSTYWTKLADVAGATSYNDVAPASSLDTVWGGQKRAVAYYVKGVWNTGEVFNSNETNVITGFTGQGASLVCDNGNNTGKILASVPQTWGLGDNQTWKVTMNTGVYQGTMNPGWQVIDVNYGTITKQEYPGVPWTVSGTGTLSSTLRDCPVV